MTDFTPMLAAALNDCPDPTLPPPTLLSAGANHTCALPGDGTVECWGLNRRGQLGNGTKRDSAVHVKVLGIDDAVSVEALDDFACALRARGTVECWGAYSPGDSEPSSTPVVMSGVTTAIALLGNGRCALVAGRAITCWSWEQTIQYPDGTPTVDPARIVKAPMNGDATCSLLNTGAVACRGLLRGTSTTFHSGSYPTDAVDVTVGADFACSLSAAGDVGCWGLNEYLQLGAPYSPWYRASPYILPFHGVVSIAAGGRHACAVLDSGDVWCWGTNRWGELGNGRRSGIGVWGEAPSQVANVHDAVAVSAGEQHTCVLRLDHSVYCWGLNYNGQLGNGVLGYSTEPVQAVGVTDAVNVSAGAESVCAVLAGGTVECWGENSMQQLGDGTTVSRDLAAPVVGITAAVQVSVGELHACAVLSGGGITCWGSSANGRIGSLGPQSTTVYPTSPPISVPEISNAVGVVAGYRHTCALLADGTVSCWGAQSALPDPPPPYAYPAVGVPMTVPDLFSVKQLWSPGNDATCALGTDHNSVPVKRCWGWLAFTYQDPVSPSGSAVLSPSYYRSSVSCSVHDDGTVWCSGDNIYGQLGAGIANVLPNTAPVRMFLSRTVQQPITNLASAEPPQLQAVEGISLATSPRKVSGLAVTPPPGYKPTFGGTTTTTTSTPSSSSTGASSTTSGGTSATTGSTPTTGATTSTSGGTPPTTGGAPSTSSGSTTSTSVVVPLSSATPGNRSAKITWPGDAWSGFGSIGLFQLQRSGDSGKTWRPIASLSKVKRSHVVQRLINGTTYRFRIRPVRGKVVGAWIESNSVTPRTVPSQPRLVRAVAGNGMLTVTWLTPLFTGGAPVLEYRVQSSTNGRSWGTALVLSPALGPNNSAVLSGLPNGVKRFVRVVAVNVAGASKGTVSRKVAPSAAAQ